MTGPEHYLEGERLLSEVTERVGSLSLDMSKSKIALAHAHFAAAQAAATALQHFTEGGMSQPDRLDWYKVASGGPAEKERIQAADAARAAETEARERASYEAEAAYRA